MLEAPPEVRSQTAAEYDKWRRRGRYYHDRITANCRFHVAAGARVLELGCGNGDLLAAVRPARGVGIDLSAEMVACAQRRHPELEFLCLDAQGFQLDERFDYIVLSNVLHEVQDVQAVLANLPHVCHERTRILIHNYNYLWEPVLRAASRLGLRRPVPCQNWLDFARHRAEIASAFERDVYAGVPMEGLVSRYVPELHHARVTLRRGLVNLRNAEIGVFRHIVGGPR